MRQPSLEEHLFGEGPKRILALDGGGVRGALTLEYLAVMEDLLKKRSGGDPDFRLCDYFDLIGGTSTGAIIATSLALGFTVADLQELYRNLANEVFEKPPWRFGLIVSKFPVEPLAKVLKQHFGDTTLGGEQLRTGLMVMTKRLDTASPWPLHNNPRGRYYNESAPGRGGANKDFLLRDIVRASTAAPHFFQPERIQVAEGQYGGFVDGGVSPHNNPALQLLLLATMKGYSFEWPLGADRLLLISVGTGAQPMRMTADKVMELPATALALRSLASLMDDATWLVQTILQWMSDSNTAWPIDREIGALDGEYLTGQPLLKYQRYNVELDRAWLKERVGHDEDEETVAGLHAMDDAKNVEALARVGGAAARVQIEAEHFPSQFDIG